MLGMLASASVVVIDVDVGRGRNELGDSHDKQPNGKLLRTERIIVGDWGIVYV
jgi:hypothetical protein